MEQEEKQKNINKFDKIAGSYNLVDYIIPRSGGKKQRRWLMDWFLRLASARG